MRRHRHDATRTVVHQYEIRRPHRHPLAGQRMDHVDAQGHAALFHGFQRGLLHVGLPGFVDEGGHRLAARRCFQRQRMLRRHRNEAHAIECVRTRGEHGDVFVAIGQPEVDLQTFGAPDPVGLHGLDRVRPVRQPVQLGQQLVRVVRNLQEPLRNLALLHHGAGTPAASVDHLLIGQHRLVDRIPVHDRGLLVDQALLVELDEEPLLPAVIRRLTGRQAPIPVIGDAQLLELAAHVVDIGIRPLRRRHAVLHRRVLGRQAEGIEADRLQHVPAKHALIARDHVPDRVIAHMPHVQAPARIRKHRKAIELLARHVLPRLERLVLVPECLGILFNFAR